MASSPATGTSAARDRLPRLAVEGENAPGVPVQPAACVGEYDFPAGAAEQGHAEFAFEGLHALADGGLGETDSASGSSKVRPLGGLNECAEVGKRVGH